MTTDRMTLPFSHVSTYFYLSRTSLSKETPKARTQEVLLMRHRDDKDGEMLHNPTGLLYASQYSTHPV